VARRTKNKKSAQRIHFRRRSLQRYGISLGSEEQKEIAGIIRNGKALFVSRISARLSVFMVYYRDTELKVVYDSFRHSLATALPLEDSDFIGDDND